MLDLNIHPVFTRTQSSLHLIDRPSQFFADVKEAEEKIKKMQEAMKKKYVCDRSITVTRLEDLLQDAVVRTKH